MSVTEGTPSQPLLDLQSLSLSDRQSCEYFNLGNFVLDEGLTLRGAKLAYKAWGRINDRKDNLTIRDNVRAQHQLVTQRFGVSKLALVLGGSMGALQTFQWAVSHPDMVERIAPWCGAAKTSPHNIVFLEGVKAALTADAAFKGGWYEDTARPELGLRAMARVWAGWGLSQQFYWHEVWKPMGFSSLEDWLTSAYEGQFLQGDANNLLAMLWTWQHADISTTPGFDGDYKKALAAIKARAVVMPGEMDLYFPARDAEFEVSHMPNARLKVIPGLFGHASCSGKIAEDAKFISDCIKELLA